jgi:PTS system mannose-specific IIA component
MFGGTPSNLALTFLEPGRIEVVTGVNLPMLIALARPTPGASFEARIRRLCEHGHASIRVASELLEGDRRSGPEPW